MWMDSKMNYNILNGELAKCFASSDVYKPRIKLDR